MPQNRLAEAVFLNFYGAQESIPRNQFRQPMHYAAWHRRGIYINPNPALFLAPVDCSKILALVTLRSRGFLLVAELYNFLINFFN